MPVAYESAEIPQMDPTVQAVVDQVTAATKRDDWFRPTVMTNSPVDTNAVDGAIAEALGNIGKPSSPRQASMPPVINGRFADNVPRTLINTESGGNWFATNDEVGSNGKVGHDGILQFGDSRLQDAKRAGIIPSDMTREQFRMNMDAQIAVSNWHFADIDNRIQSQGLDRFLGSNVGGVNISMNALRGMAHLGGFSGMAQFLTSGGKYNPSDAYGTSLRDYGQKHG
jgi:hypothetical protein